MGYSTNVAYIHVEEDGQPYVNRTMPIIMEDHVQKSEWKQFCDQLDKALIPAFKFQRAAGTFYFSFFINFFLLLVNAMVTQLIIRLLKESNSNGFRLGIGDIILLSHIGITCVVTMAYIILSAYWHRSMRRFVRTEFSRICNELSRTKPSLNFCVYDKKVKSKGHIVSMYVQITISTRKTAGSTPASKGVLVPKFRPPQREEPVDRATDTNSDDVANNV